MSKAVKERADVALVRLGLAESRAKAAAVMAKGKPVNRAAAVVIAAIWLLLAALGVALGWRLLQ